MGGEVLAADITDGMQANTAAGVPVTFSVSGNNVMVENANVVATDSRTANGVVHAIDRVMMPASQKGPSTLPVTGGATQGSTYIVVLAVVLGLLLAGASVTRALAGVVNKD